MSWPELPSHSGLIRPHLNRKWWFLLLRETKRDCLGLRTAIESKLWGGWGRSQDNCTSSDLKCKFLNCLTMSRNDLTVSERLYRSQNDQCYYHLILEVLHHTMVQLPVTASPQGVPTSLINHQLNTDINTVWMLLYYGCHYICLLCLCNSWKFLESASEFH